MKILDKIKDLFMDEVVVDDEVELEEEGTEKYQEPSLQDLPKVMQDTIKEEEKVDIEKFADQLFKKGDNIVKEENLDKVNEHPSKKFDFPIDFTDELPSSKTRPTPNVNVLDIEKESSKRISQLYSKKDKLEEKPRFKASPVISPVYGILDKNYSKDEVREKPENDTMMKRPSKKVDFETVRKKAFGNLVDEIKDNIMCESCVLYQEAKKKTTLNEDDLLYDMTVDNSQDVTIEKAYDDYEEFGVAYEPHGKHEALEETKIDEEKIINNNIEHTLDEEIPPDHPEKLNDEEIITKGNKSSEKKETVKVDDDFFELIDSMYKERIDE